MSARNPLIGVRPGRHMHVSLRAAWFGELLVVGVIAPLLAAGVDLVHGPLIWPVATGGPIQPLAAVIGELIGKTLARWLRPIRPS